MKTDANGA